MLEILIALNLAIAYAIYNYNQWAKLLTSIVVKNSDQKKRHKNLIKYEDIDEIFSRVGKFGMTEEVEKLVIKAFKDKKEFREVQNLILDKVDNVLMYSIITLYWHAYYIYYYNDQFEDLISDCLNKIDEKMPLLNSPRYCRKVYFYINTIKIFK